MKKVLPVLVIVFMGMIAITSCSEKLHRADRKLKEIKTPFDSKKYFSDKKNYRATGEGRAMDLTVAKRMAETNARQDIASQIQVQMRSVTEQYLQNRNLDTKVETQSKYEDITRQVVDQTLRGVKIVDAQSFQNKKGVYVHYVAMELPTDQVVNDAETSISNDSKLKQDFDLQKFREIYNQELEKFQQKNSNN